MKESRPAGGDLPKGRERMLKNGKSRKEEEKAISFGIRGGGKKILSKILSRTGSNYKKYDLDAKRGEKISAVEEIIWRNTGANKRGKKRGAWRGPDSTPRRVDTGQVGVPTPCQELEPGLRPIRKAENP